jgi:WD40 repeat protein
VWDLRGGSCSAVLEGHATLVRAVAVSVDGRTAVSGAGDMTVRVWDLRGGCCALLEGHTGSVTAVAVSADGRTAVSGARDRTVRVWDLRGGSCSAVLEGHTGRVTAVAVSADGRTAVSGADDKTVRVWDLRGGSCSAVHPSDSPEAIAAWASVRGAGSFHASLSNDGVALTCAPDSVLARFSGSFTRAACSPDGNFLIAGDGRGQVYLLRLRGPGA